LSSFLLKCHKKIIKDNWKDSFLLSPLLNQHGFTEGHSCESALDKMVDTIEKNINKKGHICIAVFLDIQGAFDNVQFSSIERELCNRGANNKTIVYYSYLLKNRTIHTTIKGITKTINPIQGTPQGDPLSDVIWNIIYQPIIEKISQTNVLPNALADDITLLYGGNDKEKIVTELQKAIDIILEWGKQEHLTFNPKLQLLLSVANQDTNQMKLQG